VLLEVSREGQKQKNEKAVAVDKEKTGPPDRPKANSLYTHCLQALAAECHAVPNAMVAESRLLPIQGIYQPGILARDLNQEPITAAGRWTLSHKLWPLPVFRSAIEGGHSLERPSRGQGDLGNSPSEAVPRNETCGNWVSSSCVP
jgi:hypothetical protein